MKYFNILGSMIKNDARYTREIKCKSVTLHRLITQKTDKFFFNRPVGTLDDVREITGLYGEIDVIKIDPFYDALISTFFLFFLSCPSFNL